MSHQAKKPCRCGSTSHSRVTHASCPLNPKKQLENVPPGERPKLPRIGRHTSHSALKCEAKARGGVDGYTTMDRETLLATLGVGSIHVSATREYRAVQEMHAMIIEEAAAWRREACRAIVPQLHPCPLTRAVRQGWCAFCRDAGIGYRCERCDFDVCVSCFKRVDDSGSVDAQLARVLGGAPSDYIKNVADQQIPRGWTVWWSGQGHVDKIFDSSWSSSRDANARARYKFFADNPWGPQAILDLVDTLYETTRGPAKLAHLTVAQPDAQLNTWTVGVVPDDAFEHLDNARTPPRSEDDEASFVDDVLGDVVW